MDVRQQRAVNKKISQVLRTRGMSVRPEALKPLYALLVDGADDNWEKMLHALLDELQLMRRKPRSPLEACHSCVSVGDR